MVSKAGFEESLLPHMKAAFNLAYWIVRSREEAEDVVQDAYLRAFRAFSRFDGAAAKPGLLTIARNVAYRALQSRNRAGNVMLLNDDLQSVGATPCARSRPPSRPRKCCSLPQASANGFFRRLRSCRSPTARW